MDETIRFTVPATGEEVEFEILEQTRVNGTDYILVTTATEDEMQEAFILKDLSKEEDAEALYEMVDDDVEFESVAKLFKELAEDDDFDLE